MDRARGKVYPLSRVDPVKNARRARAASCLDEPHHARVAFDPAAALVDRALGRKVAQPRDVKEAGR